MFMQIYSFDRADCIIYVLLLKSTGIPISALEEYCTNEDDIEISNDDQDRESF